MNRSDRPGGRLSLRLLGGFEFRLPTGQRVALPGKKSQALLAYLVVNSGAAHPRDKLAALLWSDVPDHQARQSLRQTLFSMRRAIPALSDALHVDDSAVALAPEAVDVDTEAFERLVAEATPASLDEAAQIYRGDFLAGIGVGDTAFEEWLIAERERLRERALEGLARLLSAQMKVDGAPGAVATALRLVTLDPLQESAHRTLMRLYDRDGRRDAALRQYQACVDVLARELGVEPEGETRSLYQAIVQRRTEAPAADVRPAEASERTPAAAPTTTAPMVGRDAERARLATALDAAFAGAGRTVAILGEAGIGKSRLVRAVVEDAGRRQGRVVLGQGWQAEQTLPFGPWLDAFRAANVVRDDAVRDAIEPFWRAQLARLLPELGADTSARSVRPEEPIRLFEAVAVLLERLASSQPLLLVLEDLHWADETSLRLLSFVVRRAQAWPALILVTAREEEVDDVPILRDVLRRPEVTRLSLGSLSSEDMHELVRMLARSGDDPSVLASRAGGIWAASEGNPFLAIETIRALEQGAAPATPGELPVSERIREVVRARVERLGRSARQVVVAASVIGREVEWALLPRASGLGEPETAEAIEELVRRRLLRVEHERFDFVHSWIREVVYGDLLPPRRRLLHRQVGEALEELHASDLAAHADALGRHYHEAQEWARALSYLRQAGARAMEHSAYHEAATCFERAIQAWGRLTPDRRGIEEGIDLRLQLRLALTPSGDHEAQCLALLTEARALVERTEDRQRLADVLLYQSFHHWVGAELEAGRAVAEQALALAREEGSRGREAEARIRLGRVLSFLGAYRASLDELEQALGMLDEIADRGLTPTLQVPAQIAFYQACSLVETGKLSEAIARLEPGVRLAEATGHHYSRAILLAARGFIDLRNGDPAPAIPALQRSLALCEQVDFRVVVPGVTTWLGEALVAAGRGDEALPILRECASQTGPWQRQTMMALAAACLATGRLEEAFDLTVCTAEDARRRGERGTEAWAHWLLGEVGRVSQPVNVGAAVESYRAALDLAGTLGMQPLVARCHLGLGALHAASGRPALARDHATLAASLFREMDSPFWLARAESLANLGI